MADYTKFGIAVPPLQRHWLAQGKGFVAEPHLDGVVAALHTVHQGRLPEEQRAAAVAFVRKTMSARAVVGSFLALVRAPWERSGAAKLVLDRRRAMRRDVVDRYDPTKIDDCWAEQPF